VEPSAGTGAFLKPFEEETTLEKLLSYDIDPKYPNVVKQDFLETFFEEEKRYIVIGNPPFGRQASLAKKFIKHCCVFADVICFILPRSFKKSSMTNCFERHFHKVYEEDVDDKSFIFEESEYSVPCVFQIWEKKGCKRPIAGKNHPDDWYDIVKVNEEANIAFRRVGVYAGKFTFEGIDKLSPESHYFIKSKVDINEVFKAKLSTLSWETNNTTGPKSISKQELIANLNTLTEI
jgi:hypothetical protein